MRRIAGLERALADDGAVLVKCWLHVDRRTQAERLAALAADPLRRWRAGKAQQRRLRLHRRIVGAWERAAAVTGTEQAPWHVIDAAREDHRHLHVAKQVLAGIEQALAASAQPEVPPHPETPARPETPVPTEVPAPNGASPPPETPARPEAPVPAETQAPTGASPPPEAPARPAAPTPETPASAHAVTPVTDHLGALDLTRTIDRDRSRIELERQQGRLYRAQQRARERGVSTVVVFEGWDAGGKGGAIRRATAALDARYYRVIPIAAPTDEELAHHYLWRFWRHLSRAGEIVMFDRSWYGRVLVERVEEFAAPHEWRRAYDEIRQFEEQLVEHGIVLVKFWLHIGREEQLRRFRDREATPYKRWKITGEDWRNRERWDDYVAAVNEMVERTSTRRAPWTLVEGNDKRFARLQVVRTLADRLRRAARLGAPDPRLRPGTARRRRRHGSAAPPPDPP